MATHGASSIFGKDIGKTAAPLIALVSFGFVIYIFGASLNLWRGPYDVFYWWSSDVTELMIVLLIFGLVVWFIVKDPTKESDVGKKLWEGLGSLIEDRK